MRKLLLFLMLLIAAAPPLLADYEVEVSLVPAGGGNKINLLIDWDQKFEMTDIPLGTYTIELNITEGGVAVSDGTITFSNGFDEGAEDATTLLNHASGAAWNEGWTLEAKIVGKYAMLEFNYTPTSGDGISGTAWMNIIDGAAETPETVNNPKVAITSDLEKNHQEIPVFLKNVSFTLTPSDTEGATTYYFESSDPILVETDKENAKYVVEKKDVYVPGHGYQNLTYYYIINEKAEEYTGSDELTFTNEDLAENSFELSLQTVAATEKTLSDQVNANAYCLFPLSFIAEVRENTYDPWVETDVAGTEADPFDTTKSLFNGISINCSLPGKADLSELGVTLYYTFNDGEPIEATGNTVDLSGLVGKQKITAWYQKTDDEALKSNELSTWIELATPDKPEKVYLSNSPLQSSEVYGETETLKPGAKLYPAYESIANETTVYLPYNKTGVTLEYQAPGSEEWITFSNSNPLELQRGMSGEYKFRAVLTEYPTVTSIETSMNITVKAFVDPKFYLYSDGHISSLDNVELYEGDQLAIVTTEDATLTCTMQKEGEEESNVELTLENAELGWNVFTLEKAGEITYKATLTDKEDASISESVSLTVNVNESVAPTISLTMQNDEAPLNPELDSASAYICDQITITAEQVRSMPFTVAYSISNGEEEVASEPAAAYTEPVVVTLPKEAGIYTLTVKAALADDEEISAEKTLTVDVKAFPVPLTPVFRINGNAISGTAIEGQEVSIIAEMPAGTDLSAVIEYSLEEPTEETVWEKYENPILLETTGQVSIWARAYANYEYNAETPITYSQTHSVNITVLEDLSQEEVAMSINFKNDDTSNYPTESATFISDNLTTTPEGLVSEVSASTLGYDDANGVFVNGDKQLLIAQNQWVTFTLDPAKVVSASQIKVTLVDSNSEFEMAQYNMTELETLPEDAEEGTVAKTLYSIHKQTFNGASGEVTMDITNPLGYITISNTSNGALKITGIEVVAEVERAEMPTITVDEENGTVTITPGRNTAQVYWACSTEVNPQGHQYKALVEEGEAIQTSYEVTPEGPGYIYAYAESQDYPNIGVLASEYAGGEGSKFRFTVPEGSVVIRMPDAYYDPANREGVNGVFYDKIAASAQVTPALYTVNAPEEEDGEDTYTAFSGDVADLTFSVEEEDGIKQDETQYGVAIEFNGAGVYTLSATWNEDAWYIGTVKCDVPVNVFAELKAGNMETMTGTNTEGKSYSVPFIQITEADEVITFTVDEGVEVYYSFLDLTKENAQSIMRKAAEFDPTASGFELAENNEITAQGENGAFLAVTKANGVYSPAQQYYYGTDSEILKDITTGICGVNVAGEGAEYYDLNGYRVSGNELKAGIYVRVVNGKASKVVVK